MVILTGDAIAQLRTLDAGSVQTCVTSPPYWGLRDYGVKGQIGLEPTPAEYVARMVEVFAEVRRVLKDDGTLWLNLGDSYAGSWGNQGRKETRGTQRPINGPMIQRFKGYPEKQPFRAGNPDKNRGVSNRDGLGRVEGIASKNLIGIPWRVAFALQADGWILRSDIIWAKPNPMPESVRDRPTKAHEYLFLLAKQPRYFYDADAIKEPGAMRASGATQNKYNNGDPMHQTKAGIIKIRTKVYPRVNKRTVWTVTPQPFRGAHFATFPPRLIEPCILAGSREGDAVLDPFAGAGTTPITAERLGRRGIGIELNREYVKMAKARAA